MTEIRRRPTLHLKLGATPKVAADGQAPEVMATPKSGPAARTTTWTKPKTVTRTFREPQSGGGGRVGSDYGAPPSPPPVPAGAQWKCKPCGARFAVADFAETADADPIRCPACNAKLGLASDFRADPPNTEKLRARAV